MLRLLRLLSVVFLGIGAVLFAVRKSVVDPAESRRRELALAMAGVGSSALEPSAQERGPTNDRAAGYAHLTAWWGMCVAAGLGCALARVMILRRQPAPPFPALASSHPQPSDKHDHS